MADTDMIPDDDAQRAFDAFTQAGQAIDRAVWLARMPRADGIARLVALPMPARAEVFAYMPLDAQADFTRLLPEGDLAILVNGLDADDRADLYNHLPPEEGTRLLRGLTPEDRADVHRLAAFGEATAGAIMTSDFATLDPAMTAAQAIDALRRAAPDSETIYRSYVTDAGGHLIGAVRLHHLILAPDDATVGALMDKAPVSVTLDTGREEVARVIARYDVLAVPVVDAENRLSGIVTHDDAADALQAETTEDFQKISTVMPFSQSLRDAGFRVLYSRRIVWLALLVFGNLFSGAGIAFFEDTILAHVALVFFLPLLIDSSGNAGSQAATLMVRALATGDVEMSDWGRLILREVGVAAALGLTMAAVVLPLGAWRGGPDVAMAVGLTMVVVVMIGSLVGMSLPFLLSRLRLDPATASGPLVTTISDAVGVLVYFSIATAVLAI